MANGRALIDPPPFVPLQFGLLSAAIDRSADAPSHWQAGVTWQSHCPDGDGTYDPCLTVTRGEEYSEETAPVEVETPPKEPTSEFFLRGATPFAVVARFDCAPVGFWERANALATEALTRVEGHQVERIFSTGTAPVVGTAVETVYPHLAADTPLVDDTGAALQTVADVITDAPVDIVEALGRLESALASCYHGRGVIHSPALLSAELSAHDLARRQGDQLLTLAGNRVALGSGYANTAPDGVPAADGVAWLYATGAVFYFRSEIAVHQIEESFNRSHNTVQAIAERRYVMGWDCCHLAIPVHAGGIGSGAFDSADPLCCPTEPA